MVQSYLVRQGCGFWWYVLFRPPPPPTPELNETGTIRKHWNRGTIYAETKRVLEQLSEIRAGMFTKKLWLTHVICYMESVQVVILVQPTNTVGPKPQQSSRQRG